MIQTIQSYMAYMYYFVHLVQIQCCAALTVTRETSQTRRMCGRYPGWAQTLTFSTNLFIWWRRNKLVGTLFSALPFSHTIHVCTLKRSAHSKSNKVRGQARSATWCSLRLILTAGATTFCSRSMSANTHSSLVAMRKSPLNSVLKP